MKKAELSPRDHLLIQELYESTQRVNRELYSLNAEGVSPVILDRLIPESNRILQISRELLSLDQQEGVQSLMEHFK